MTTSLDPMFPTIWRQLPDPRDSSALEERGGCSLSMDESVWSKVFIEKHRADPNERRGWQDWLSARLVAELPQIWDQNKDATERLRILTEVSTAMELGVRSCLQRPLVVVYDKLESGDAKRRPSEQWELVLPAGALLVTRMVGAKGAVKTVFFMRSVCNVVPVSARWRELVRLLVERYAQLVGGNRQPPDASYVVGEQSELIVGIRFVSLDEWGFCGELPPNHWDAAYLEPWSAEKPLTRLPERRLSPRRFSGEEDDNVSSG